MAQTLAAKLLKLKPTPILDADILAALMGQGELPADVVQIARALEAEATAVAQARQALGDVPPVPVAGGPVLL
jgi:hypothetical protein